jgi:Protein of unknown function (DUF2971)
MLRMSAPVSLWEAGGRDLSSCVEVLLESCADSASAPNTLFHFTDSDGLIGILTTKVLRAALATALSDAAETKYAIARLCSLLRKERIKPKSVPAGLLCQFLERRRRIPLADDVRAYVVSFCGADEAIHWLHYGRSGTGVAIGFETAGLTASQFSLCRVIYNQARQDELFGTLVDLVDKFAGEMAGKVGTLDFSDQGHGSLDDVACHLTTMYLRLLAPRMKDPVFKSEDEWRLITHEAWRPGEPEEPTRKTLFMSIGGRIVPFKEIEFEMLPVTEIVLGTSAPMQIDEQALAVLMENTLERTCPVRRSTVAVRP